MNALELHDKLTVAHSEGQRIQEEADRRQRVYGATLFVPGEGKALQEEDKIRELRAKAREYVSEINSMRAMLRGTEVKE